MLALHALLISFNIVFLFSVDYSVYVDVVVYFAEISVHNMDKECYMYGITQENMLFCSITQKKNMLFCSFMSIIQEMTSTLEETIFTVYTALILSGYNSS